MADDGESGLSSRGDETGSSLDHHGPLSLHLQLPSNQTLRYRGNKAAAWGQAWEEASKDAVDPQELVPEFVLREEEKDSRPLKELPLCLQEKRKLRALQEQATQRLNGWELWRVEKRRMLQRLNSQVGAVISDAEIWRSSLRNIEVWNRDPVLLQLSTFSGPDEFCRLLLVVGFVIAPNATFEALRLNWTSHLNGSLVNVSCLRYSPTPQGLVSYPSYVMDLLSGKGFIEQTYLFYGYYKNSAVNFVGFSYNIPLAYLLTAFFYLLFCLSLIVRRSVYCLKRSLVSEDASLGSYSNKVFAGWDFGLMQQKMVQLRHKSIRYELRMDLEEAALRKHQAEQTTGQRVCLYTFRGLLNILVLTLLGGAFYCIYRATDYSQWLLGNSDSPVKGQYFLELLVAYLPSAVITTANLIVPLIFEVIVRQEKYPLSFEIKITLIRNVFLRLASLVVVLFSLWTQITCSGNPQNSDCLNCGYNNHLHPCWETSVGQEMYKLMIFDLLIMLLVMLFVEFPRKMLVTSYPSCLFFKWWGQQEFLVPYNVLDLVYGQTLCWAGALFCPLLPVLNTIKFIIVFYLKKVSILGKTLPGKQTLLGRYSNFFFLLVLLLGLIISCVPALYSMFV
ncbi:hypothetical protein JRQ81_005846 [Phrynocephalus forsythii]|uniref:Transmembrane channel-like protein n=1 Tax=Phrynocephalus forsythii TaxID=171643 RepID=A0A9Q0XIP1_9SAUR|nr:hypothetical protein JRQ81_005846 [Phrynocephalus forsythii]